MTDRNEGTPAQSRQTETRISVLWTIAGAWFVGFLVLLAFGLLNSIATFLFDVMFVPEELMGSELGVALLLTIGPLLVGGLIFIIGAWVSLQSTDDMDSVEAPSNALTPAEPADPFLIACFEHGLSEEYDPRTFVDFPLLAEVDNAHDNGDSLGALGMLEEGLAEYSDSFLFHCRLAGIHYDLGDSRAADQALRLGLRKSLSKTNICERIGTYAFENSDYAEAIRWWIIATHIQLTSGRPVHYVPYLKLSYVADGLGMVEVKDFLKRKSDRMNSSGPIELAEDAAQELRGVGSALMNEEPISKALAKLIEGRSMPEPVAVSEPIPRGATGTLIVNETPQGISVARVGSLAGECPLCGSLMVSEPNHVHCDSGHSKIVVDPRGRSYLARSQEVANQLGQQGYRVEAGGGAGGPIRHLSAVTLRHQARPLSQSL